MSKFFAEGNISDEDSDNVSDDNEPTRAGPSYDYDFLDDDRISGGKRVVRSEKDKKWNLIKEIAGRINKALNIRDFEKVWAELQKLLKQVESASKLIDKEGYPSSFLKILKRVQDEIEELNADSEEKKKLKKHAASAFNTMRQKLKKIYPEFEPHIKNFIENGEGDDDGPGGQGGDGDAPSSSESSSSDEEEDMKKLLESPDPMVRRKYWLKRPTRKESEAQKDAKDNKDEEKKKPEKEKGDKKVVEKVEVEKKKKKTDVQIQSIKDAENRMREIRKNFVKLNNQEDREDYLSTLDKISENELSYKDFEKLSFHLLDVPIRTDVCRQMRRTHFPRTQWTKLYSKCKAIYDLVRESEEEDLVENVRLVDQGGEGTVTEGIVYASLKTYLILIENELKKALIFIDCNESEFALRLQDLMGLVELMYRVSNELQSRDMEKDAAELAFKVIENVYYMQGELLERIAEHLKEDSAQFLQLGSDDRLEEYAQLVLRNRPEEQVRVKTLLYIIYNHAVNQRERGKELLMVSTIADVIYGQDHYTQSVYNRALAQLGIAAFVAGNMFEVQQFLYDLCSVAKLKQNTRDVLKEYLAQGYSRSGEAVRSKTLPAHLHLNVETIETVELVASMLLEIPYTLTEGGRITSKTVKRLVYQYERSYFIQESNNNRDLIYAASLKLKNGDWKECLDRLKQLSIWKSLPHADTALSNIERTVKEQALKCYLIGNHKCFLSLSLRGLSAKFDLDQPAIRRTACRLSNQKLLHISITSNGFLMFQQRRQSEGQKICESLFLRLKETAQAQQNLFNQKVNAGYDSEEELDQEDQVFKRPALAITERLRSILDRRSKPN